MYPANGSAYVLHPLANLYCIRCRICAVSCCASVTAFVGEGTQTVSLCLSRGFRSGGNISFRIVTKKIFQYADQQHHTHHCYRHDQTGCKPVQMQQKQQEGNACFQNCHTPCTAAEYAALRRIERFVFRLDRRKADDQNRRHQQYRATEYKRTRQIPYRLQSCRNQQSRDDTTTKWGLCVVSSGTVPQQHISRCKHRTLPKHTAEYSDCKCCRDAHDVFEEKLNTAAVDFPIRVGDCLRLNKGFCDAVGKSCKHQNFRSFRTDSGNSGW